MKGFLKVALSTAILTVAFAGSAFAYGQKANQSNNTGLSPLEKQVNGQKTHTEFKSNTNSCASCHMTHTANSANLLFGTSTQDTCLACHDGSLGFYNVKTGELYTNGAAASVIEVNPALATKGLTDTSTVVSSNAGSFDRTAPDSSMHNVDTHKSLSVKAAPGGNYRGTTAENKESIDFNGKWGDDFTCASCHAPHGSYSERLLHYNPNGFAEVDVKDRGFGLTRKPTSSTTSELLGYDIIDLTALASYTFDYAVVRATKAEHVAEGATWLDEVANDTDVVVMVYAEKSTDVVGVPGYKPDNTPWIYAPGANYPYTYENNKFIDDKGTPEVLTDDTKVTPKTAGVTFNFGKGYATGAPLATAGLNHARIARASVVDLDLVKVATYLPKSLDLLVTNNAALVGGSSDANGIKAVTVSGMGQKFSKFCATCHVDYLANSSNEAHESVETGYYNLVGSEGGCNACHVGAPSTVTTPTVDAKFRHTTDNDSYSCARCHMSHGTNAYLMEDATGLGYTELLSVTNPDTSSNYTSTEALAHLDDINPSSAIKRYTNMAVCWSCHTSSAAESLVNNDDYQANKFTDVKIFGAVSWTEGNRFGFGKPAATPGLTYIQTFPDTVTTTSNSGKYDDFYPVNGVLDVYPSGGSVTVQKLSMEFNSWSLLDTADKVATDVFEGSTDVGNITFDATTKKATLVFDTAYLVDGINPEKNFNFTLAGKQYEVNLLQVKPAN